MGREEQAEMREKAKKRKTGRTDGQDERNKKNKGGKRAFLTLNNDTTIGLCFLFSAD